MDSVIVAIPNDNMLAAELGKKGSENGITFYNRKAGDSAIVILTPTDVKTKFYALGEAISLADLVVIGTSNVDGTLGEAIIASALLGKKVIFTKENDISGILKSITGFEHEFLERNGVLAKLSEFKREKADGELRIEIDKAFPVKGIGTVLLGIVTSGKVKVHDVLKSSGGKEISVRSIQVHDADYQEAGVGDRVGLAVKGIEPHDVEKGEILSKNIMPYLASFSASIKRNPILKDLELENINCMLVSRFSVANCKVFKSGEAFTVKMDKPIAIAKGDDFILIRDKSPRVFASGRVLG